jgi:hypothetical protein
LSGNGHEWRTSSEPERTLGVAIAAMPLGERESWQLEEIEKVEMIPPTEPQTAP